MVQISDGARGKLLDEVGECARNSSNWRLNFSVTEKANRAGEAHFRLLGGCRTRHDLGCSGPDAL